MRLSSIHDNILAPFSTPYRLFRGLRGWLAGEAPCACIIVLKRYIMIWLAGGLHRPFRGDHRV